MFHVQPEKHGRERSRDKLRVRRGKVVADIQMPDLANLQANPWAFA